MRTFFSQLKHNDILLLIVYVEGSMHVTNHPFSYWRQQCMKINVRVEKKNLEKNNCTSTSDPGKLLLLISHFAGSRKFLFLKIYYLLLALVFSGKNAENYTGMFQQISYCVWMKYFTSVHFLHTSLLTHIETHTPLRVNKGEYITMELPCTGERKKGDSFLTGEASTWKICFSFG